MIRAEKDLKVKGERVEIENIANIVKDRQGAKYHPLKSPTNNAFL